MNRDPVQMSDAEVTKAHKLALKKVQEWKEAVYLLEWHMMVRKHIKKQVKINRLDEMKSQVAKLEKELEAAE